MRKLIRYTEKIDKVTFLDWFLHLFRVHLIRRSSSDKLYCRICGKELK